MAKSLKNINPVLTDLEITSLDAPERINWSSVSGQIISVMNIERGLFYTLIELLFRPGKAVRIHLFKNRKSEQLSSHLKYIQHSGTNTVYLPLSTASPTRLQRSCHEHILKCVAGGKQCANAG